LSAGNTSGTPDDKTKKDAKQNAGSTASNASEKAEETKPKTASGGGATLVKTGDTKASAKDTEDRIKTAESHMKQMDEAARQAQKAAKAYEDRSSQEIKDWEANSKKRILDSTKSMQEMDKEIKDKIETVVGKKKTT